MAEVVVDASFPTQLIYGDGKFNSSGVEDFVNNANLAESEYEYAVVSIMGPQSSGKSTLLNHLFHTKFQEMDAKLRRSQTTKGVWMARCVGIEPCTIVLDLEGNDSRERGSDTLFEKQIALFAIAMSDIVLINLWGNEIGRESPSFKPLLQIVFEVFLTRLHKPRRTTLLFTVRDPPVSPLEHLESLLTQDIQKIWDCAPKSETNKEMLLEDYFNVKITAFPHYQFARNEFEEKAFAFRRLFFNSTTQGGLAGDRENVNHASNFSTSAQQFWKLIQENKNLDIPNHRILVATTRCDEIIDETCTDFKKYQRWCKLQNLDGRIQISDFGSTINSLIEEFCEKYDEKAKYLDTAVRGRKREKLNEELLQIVQPTIRLMLKREKSETLETFAARCDDALMGKHWTPVAALNKSSWLLTQKFVWECEGNLAKWDTLLERQELEKDMNEKLSSTIIAYCQNEAKEDLENSLKEILRNPGEQMWPKIRNVLQMTESADTKLSRLLSEIEMDKKTKEDMHSHVVKDFERKVVEEAAKRAVEFVPERMENSFMRILSDPKKSSETETMKKTVIDAFTSVADLISAMASTRFDDYDDDIRETLLGALVDPIKKVLPLDGGIEKMTIVLLEELESDTWNRVSPQTTTLISPRECRSLWKNFMRETRPLLLNHMKKIKEEEAKFKGEQNSAWREENSTGSEENSEWGEENSAWREDNHDKRSIWFSNVIEVCRIIAALFGISF